MGRNIRLWSEELRGGGVKECIARNSCSEGGEELRSALPAIAVAKVRGIKELGIA